MIEATEVSILIADDHPLLLQGLERELINSGYIVVAVARDGTQALNALRLHRPHVSLLDIDMPGMTGFEVVAQAVKEGIGTKHIVLSFHKEIDYVSQAKILNIKGYLLKEDSFSEIEKCIQAVLEGNTYFSPSFDKEVLSDATGEFKKLQLLTPSERTIIKLIAQEKSNLQIAEELFVSVRTVEKHRSNIILKMELKGNTNTLTNWALTNKQAISNI
ncbi:DNA-binding response regulator [Dokdonia sinensis]|uniref:DNA-binding response regulator n=1 Tax=Dokdonia sinensis TaxID=2479847 RepID=A0A3M0G8V0_9FLAO|nr:response regulator transcription factor [Dokdonia sinensis]RMB58053.1 DNA-binding response regulator [Dokdonia sinensis]